MLKLTKFPQGPPPKVRIREGRVSRALKIQDRELRNKSYLHNTNVLERMGPEQIKASGFVPIVTSAEAQRAYQQGAYQRGLLATTLIKHR